MSEQDPFALLGTQLNEDAKADRKAAAKKGQPSYALEAWPKAACGLLATKAGGATIATSDAPVVSASPLRPASPSVTRNRLGSRPPALLSGRYLRQPRTFVSDPVLRSGRLCKHAQPNPPSAHARSSPDSGWPVCYPVRSPTSPTHEAEVTLATAALFADLPCALQSLVFLFNLSLGCIVLIVVY